MDNLVQITPELGKRMLGRAFLKVVENYEEINRWNEYPVPDADTGSNMAVTLGGVIKEGYELSDIWKKDYGNDYDSFLYDAEDALFNAVSGNAGTISAGFLIGFLAGIAPRVGVPYEIDDFFRGFEMGMRHAVSSVYTPKIGTMLDVIEAAERGAREYKGESFEEMFRIALESAKKDLPQTSTRLAEIVKREADAEPDPKRRKELNDIRRAVENLAGRGIGDAGAIGFIFLLEGLYEGMFSEEEVVIPEEFFAEDLFGEMPDISEEVDLNNPYEAQFVLEPYGDINHVREFLDELSKIGNSLTPLSKMSGDDVRVHIHTSDTEKVRSLAERYGYARNVRVVDMRNERRRLMIITDEGAMDLPWSVLAQGVLVVPFKLIFPERRNLAGTFYEKILKAEQWPTTSQPSSGAFLGRIKYALKLADEALVITISSRISKTYENSALKALDYLSDEFRERVHVFDSLNAACGQALLVYKAVELADQNKGAVEILRELEDLRGRIKFFGYPRDAKYLKRSGRLPGLKSLVLPAQRIGFHLLLGLGNGEIKKVELSCVGAGSFAARLTYKITEYFRSRRRKYGRVRFAISYAGDEEEEAKKLGHMLMGYGVYKAVQSVPEVLFTERLNRVVGVHTGPALMVAWYEE